MPRDPADRPLRLNSGDPGFAAAFSAVVDATRETPADVDATVAEIIADIRRRGDAALAELTRRFDRFDPEVSGFAISAAEVDAAIAQCAPDVLQALDVAAQRIEAFHRTQLPAGVDYRDDAGVRLGARWSAIDSAGLYVPGGTASYPSSVLMNATPAKVAGVERLVMVVPTPDGALNPLVLAAARRAGVHEIYRIVGPGNAYVAAAKRRVFGAVGIDTIAGPSEILVVADSGNDPAWIAADLLSQAEHDTAAQSILITDDARFADAVEAAVERHLVTLPRESIARQSWNEHGVIIVLQSLDEAPPLIDRLAPEHLEIAVAEPERLSRRIRHAGAIFLGRWTPEAIGDYVAGPNHVLPTSRTARYASGLGVLDFLKRTSFVECDATSFARIGPAAQRLAEVEGLDAHALSVSIRLGAKG